MTVVDLRSVGKRFINMVYSNSKAVETKVYYTLYMRD